MSSGAVCIPRQRFFHFSDEHCSSLNGALNQVKNFSENGVETVEAAASAGIEHTTVGAMVFNTFLKTSLIGRWTLPGTSPSPMPVIVIDASQYAPCFNSFHVDINQQELFRDPYALRVSPFLCRRRYAL